MCLHVGCKGSVPTREPELDSPVSFHDEKVTAAGVGPAGERSYQVGPEETFLDRFRYFPLFEINSFHLYSSPALAGGHM